MDVRELRYGNWISINYGTKEKIDIVERKAVMSDLMVAEMLDPIPLSEEWLIKFGFEKNEDHGYENVEVSFYTFNSDFIFDRINLMNSGIWQLVTAELDRNENIQFVHQLQNLFHSLTGEELTIKE